MNAKKKNPSINRLTDLPITTRKQLFELPDEIATRVTIIFYSDARDALLKALNE